jgi:hypothetical protein
VLQVSAYVSLQQAGFLGGNDAAARALWLLFALILLAAGDY